MENARHPDVWDPTLGRGRFYAALPPTPVDVHQVVRDTTGELLADTMVQHAYTIRDGLVSRMDVRD